MPWQTCHHNLHHLVHPTVLDLLLGRFSADGAAFAQIMTAILATVQASGADSAGAASGGLSDREALSLALMEQHQELAQAAAADAEQRNALYCALCGHAAKLFQGRRYIGAVKFYTAAMEFAEVRGGCMHVVGAASSFVGCCCNAVTNTTTASSAPLLTRNNWSPQAS